VKPENTDHRIHFVYVEHGSVVYDTHESKVGHLLGIIPAGVGKKRRSAYLVYALHGKNGPHKRKTQ